jgi:cephalosporin hydroxylase
MTFDRHASLAALSRHPRQDQPAKLREDLDRYAAAIRNTKPELIIECGTFQGYTAEWFASFGCDVITIDINPDYSALRRAKSFYGQKINFIKGSSTDVDVVWQVARAIDGRKTMVSLDSDHTAAHVAREISTYSSFVSPGCHLVVEDGLARWVSPYGEDPLTAIENLLIGDDQWELDEEIQNMSPITTSPMGWWRRIA